MELAKLTEKLESIGKGQFHTISYTRNCKVKKNSPLIRKNTTGIFRIGVDYENFATTKEGRESGELPPENAGLNGLEWVKFPYILKNPKTGKTLLRISTIPNNIPTVNYTLNGIITKKENITNYLYSSEINHSGEAPTVFNVNIDDIDEI